MTQERSNGTDPPLIAVVDDDVSFRRSLDRVLRCAGYAVATFGTARELLAVLPGIAARCLVLDVRLPDMTGLELQARLAAQGQCIPTVFVTAQDTPQTRGRTQQAHTLGLLLKPFDQDDLLALIDEGLRRS